MFWRYKSEIAISQIVARTQSGAQAQRLTRGGKAAYRERRLGAAALCKGWRNFVFWRYKSETAISQIAARTQSGARAQRLTRGGKAAYRVQRHSAAAADNTFLILYNLYFLFYICILLSDVCKC